MCNERVKHSELIAENERLKREVERLKEDGLTAAYLDGFEMGKREALPKAQKLATNHWLGGK